METFLNFLVALGVFCVQQQITTGNPTKISSELSSLLEKGERANIIVSFIGGIQPALDRARAQRHTDPKREIKAIVEATKEHAAESQAGVIRTLSSRSAAGGHFKYFKQFWVGNKLFVKEANAATVKVIAQDPKVAKITKEQIAQIPEDDKATDYKLPDAVPRPIWNIERIQVQQAWEELGGKKGDGVVVGIIDSGARHTHEALRDNFVGLEYGWYDAINKTAEPFDTNGHGTHVIGTVVGGEGIGVAPNAKWMSCNVSPGGRYFPAEALLECIQWMACPTLFDGTKPDCSKAPAIVSNSWGSSRGADDEFKDSILQLRAMGIIPVFAIGNEGIRCSGTQAPGELPFVIGVGASDEEDGYFYISSVGPASDGKIKPDLVAPGNEIWSAHYTGDSKYKKRYATSMATPHVSGVVALLKVRNPALTYQEAYDLLTQNTAPMKWKPLPGINSSVVCNGGADAEQTPNIFWGYGRVDAFKAVQAQTRLMSRKSLKS